MSVETMPAVALVAVGGRRSETLALGQEFERRGFSGIWCPGMLGDALALATSLAHSTADIPIGTAVQPIYARPAPDTAALAAYVTELAGPRFRLGLGVSHVSMLEARGLPHGRPLDDMRAYISAVRAAWPQGSEPNIVLAALRTRMVDLAIELADGIIWGNGALSAMGAALARIPADRQSSFATWNQMATVIDDDADAAAERCRRVLTMYTQLPNYTAYWRSVGYEEEVDAMVAAADAGDMDGARRAMTDAWLNDIALVGTATQVRERIDAWLDLGVTPILFPSSTKGGQMKALGETLDVFRPIRAD